MSIRHSIIDHSGHTVSAIIKIDLLVKSANISRVIIGRIEPLFKKKFFHRNFDDS